LALALAGAGHDVKVITTSPGPEDTDAGLRVERLRVRGRKRFALPRAFARAIAEGERTVVHAQHSLSALGCLGGADASRVAVTVRDHWPVCFWSTKISRGAPCPACGIAPMSRCVFGHVPFAAPLSWGAIPYMQADLHEKRQALLRAGATLAVSESIAGELRAAQIPRVQVIPNIVDAAEAQAVAREAPTVELPERFLLFVGKLEENKGARLLVPAVAAARTGLPLVVLGEGTLAHELKFEATARDVTLQLRGWASREDVLRALQRATALVFPSLWDEPLSRVLLEALALGTPVAAMDTGGTREILVHETSGLVVPDEAGLAEAIARIARVVTIPVSADIESGFAADTRELTETITRVIEAGAVGINLEDGINGAHGGDPLYAIEVAIERVRAAREAANSTGVPLVINARTDVYLRGVGAPESRFENAVNRANAYRKAGADCLFVPGVGRRADIEKLVSALDGPLNLLAFPGIPAPAELQQLGVARLSVGTWITLDAMALTRKVANELLEAGSYESMFKEFIGYPEGNAMMTKAQKR
jgi:2-methylisocitrate lyase-like PEP mutase family enzyme